MDVENIGAYTPTLAWSAAGPESVSSITMGLTFARPERGIKAVLITFPAGFTHSMRTSADVSVSSGFPVARNGDWADTSETYRLRLFVDTDGTFRDEAVTIPAETYVFKF